MALEDRRGNRAGVKTVEVSDFSTQTMSCCYSTGKQMDCVCLQRPNSTVGKPALITQWEIPAAHGGRQTGSHASQRRGSFQNLQPEQCILLLLMKGPDDVVLPDPSSAAAMPSTSSVTNQLALVKAAALGALILILLNATWLVETLTENLRLHQTPRPKIKRYFILNMNLDFTLF